MTLKSLKPKINQISLTRSAPITTRITGRELQAIRNRILPRDDYTCRHCGKTGLPNMLEVDHIIPLHCGGAESDDNRQTLCIPCHRLKSEKEQKNRDNL